MSPPKVYEIVTLDGDKNIYRSRNEVTTFLQQHLSRPDLKKTTVDNYIQKKNKLPPTITSLESYDMYEYLNEDFKKAYGETLIGKSTKTIQRKTFKLFDDLYNSNTDRYI
jgi:hypothetical protein